MKAMSVLSRYGTFFALVFLCVSTSALDTLSHKKIKIVTHQNENEAPYKDDPSSYQIGAGIWDITGPAAEVGMMGYAMPEQISHGIHMRLRARAFVIAQGTQRIAFVSTDSAMIFGGVKDKVIEKLQSLFGDLYSHDNVMLSGTHTHSGPAGFSYNLIYNLNSEGFVKQNFDAIVNGISKAIQMAHNSAVSGNVYINQGTLENSNINRSPTAYQYNPDKIYYDSDTDKLMTLLKFVDSASKPIGSVNWFSVHGTSMNNTNLLISGDNKGYAAYLFEKYINGNSTLPGYGPFISAFGQTNEGDVSPNTKGPSCPDGSPCDSPTSTCPPLHRNEGCIAKGPGEDIYESTQIIGTNQFQKALDLFNGAKTILQGPIGFVHTYVDFHNVTVDAQWTATGQVEKTCHGALGDSFAAGTTDGPGMFDFTQGTNTSNANTYWNFIASFLSDPTEEEKACQSPKPILLNTGDITFPNPWTANIMPLQMFRIGQLFIIGVPGEFTTMSGRRLRSTVLQALQDNGMGSDTMVVIAGLTNEYSHYITTYEEYQAQRYEGASTLFGPHTLAAYQQEYSKLAKAIALGSTVDPGPTPADLSGNTFSFLPDVIVDEHPTGSAFGAVKTNPKSGYSRGDSVVVEFWGANPRNNFLTQSSFLTVERNVNGQWKVVAVDGDWETKFQWTRQQTAESIITITWNIPSTAEPGTYRIQTYGNSKNVFDEITPYVGTSPSFSVY